MKISQNNNKKVGIYCIHNTVSGKKYIGSSINIGQRLSNHRSQLRGNYHENIYLQNAYNKYGEEVFTTYVVMYCEEKDLLINEQHYITNLNAEYNIAKDVIRGLQSNETKQKHSRTKKQMYQEGKLLPNCSKEIKVYTINGKYLGTYLTIEEVSVKLKLATTSIQRVLKKEAKQMNGFIFLYKEDLKLSHIIFPTKGKNMIVFYKENSEIYFRSYNSCAEYFKVGRESVMYFLLNAKREKFKGKYKMALIKPCELLEQLEVANQQPSDIEIY